MAQFEDPKRSDGDTPRRARSLGVPLGEFQSFVREHRHEAETDPAAFEIRLRHLVDDKFDMHEMRPHERAELSPDISLKVEEARRLAAYYRALDKRGLLK